MARGAAVALVLRHAERDAVIDFRVHEAALLTLRGHAQAHAAGIRIGRALAALADVPRLTLVHSPVARCKQTADGIALGAARYASRVQTDPDFAAPFILQRERTEELVMQLGFAAFIRDWFDDKLPRDVLRSRKDSAHLQLRTVGRYVAPGTLTVCVTHDWNIAVMREEFLQLRPEHGWPHFLDGVVVVRDDDSDHVMYKTRSERVRAA